MSGVMLIDPRGPHRLRKTISQAAPIGATIRRTDAGVSVRLSSGSSTDFAKPPSVSWDSFVASAVQWARRHGATSLTVDCELD